MTSLRRRPAVKAATERSSMVLEKRLERVERRCSSWDGRFLKTSAKGWFLPSNGPGFDGFEGSVAGGVSVGGSSLGVESGEGSDVVEGGVSVEGFLGSEEVE